MTADAHTDDDLVLTHDGPVATLWLNRPSKRNAVTFEMWQGITGICHSLADDRDVRLLVVRGVGDHFCAGADVGGIADTDPATYQAANTAAEDALARFPKPTIAYIAGSCIGGGCQIAIACDLRVAENTSRFGITPARLGIIYPAAALERVAALIGAAETKYLLYSADHIDASRARHIGLIHEHHPAAHGEARLQALTSLLATERSLMTQQATKAMLADITTHGHVSLSTEQNWATELASSSDPAEGITAFLERRPPRFVWPAPP